MCVAGWVQCECVPRVQDGCSRVCMSQGCPKSCVFPKSVILCTIIEALLIEHPILFGKYTQNVSV